VVTGGYNNTAAGAHSVVSGGGANIASGPNTFIGGGDNNMAGGSFATVPGGTWNAAQGNFSFATGRRAKAMHHGSVVFGDSQDYDKSSTGDNQFLVYAGGGMSINTAPVSGSALTVSGKVKADSAEFGSMTVTTLTSSSVSGFGTVPLGGIIMWSGSVDSVPSGWALCDSRVVNGRTTPDLRGRFIVGAGPWAQNGLTSRDPNATGGSETVTLTVGQLPAHNHNVTGNTSEGGAHTHNFRTYHANFDHAGSASEGSTKNDGDGEFTDTGAVLSAGNHSHSFNVTSGSTGSGQAIDKLPPFYALAFIMRVQ
jgi:microcystin-dependent protein